MEKPAGFDEFLKTAEPVSVAQKPAGFDEFIAPEIKEEKFGGALETAKAFGEGALAASTFGLGTGLEVALGVKPEDIAARREVNPIAHGAGQAAGLVGSSLLLPGGGAAGLLTKAGQAGAKAAGLAAAETAGQRIGAAAVKSAIEGAVFQSGDEVSKMFIGDPNQTAQTVGLNVVAAGALGGLFGAGFGGASELWNAKFGPKVKADLEAAAHQIETAGEAPHLPQDQFGTIEKPAGMLETRSNLIELDAARKRLGVKADLPTAMKYESPTTRAILTETAKNPTVAGYAIQKEVKPFVEQVSRQAENLLSQQSDETAASVGKKIKEGFINEYKNKLKPLEKSYEDLKPHLKNIEVSNQMKAGFKRGLLMNETLESSKAARATAQDIIEEMENINSVNGLKNFRTNLNNKIKAAYGGGRGGGEEGPVLLQAKEQLTALRETAIKRAEELAVMQGAGKQAKGVSAEIIAQLRKTDAEYAALKQNLERAGVETGVGNINNARAMVERFGKLSDESFVNKFFDPKDINQLNYLKENFPQQFEAARKFKLKEIADASKSSAQGKEGRFEIGKFLNQVSNEKKISPEALELLIPGGQQAIKDIQTLHQFSPEAFNTSNTSAAELIREMFGSPIKALSQNAGDAAIYALFKGIPHLKQAAGDLGSGEASRISILKFASNLDKGADPAAFKAMADYVEQAIKGEKLLNNAAKSVFDSSKIVLPSHLIPDDKNREKLDKKIRDLQTNSEQLFEAGGKVGHYMPDHGMAVAQTAGTAVQYLNSLRPDDAPKNPLDAPIVPNKIQEAEYNRALDIANQPLLVLEAVKKGTVTPSDITHLKVLYPDLYKRSADKISFQMFEKLHKKESIPYKTRIGVSMFLGQPLDGTMTPLGIQSAQPQMPAPQQQPRIQGGKKGSMKSLDKFAVAYQTPMQHRQVSKLKH